MRLSHSGLRRGRRRRLIVGRLSAAGAVGAALLTGAAAAPAASADAWLPHPPDAKWTYSWQDPKYNPNGTTETTTVASEASPNGCGWALAWTGDTQIPLGTGTGGPTIDAPDNGTICFSDQSDGLTNTDWSGDPAPFNEPPLCANAGQCASSLGSSLYDVIWGGRAPVLSEPLLQGDAWTASGGDGDSAHSVNRYIGLERVVTPAFPYSVLAAEVHSQITLTGVSQAGDAFGSGGRTTWWVYGVGPVMVQFDHADGGVTTAQLVSTNLKPVPTPPDTDYFPLLSGLSSTYKWTNRKHLPRPEIEKVAVTDAVNRTARVIVHSVSGQLNAVGAYDFALRLDGLSTTSIAMSASSLVKLPKLGHGLHFFTPIDLMTYGFNPVLPAYPVIGTTWASGAPRDTHIYGVKGSSRLVGIRRVHVPGGTFHALEVKSTLRQRGHRFGSGTRTMWLAPGRGLVKLVFDHRDGSVSRVVLLRCGGRHC